MGVFDGIHLTAMRHTRDGRWVFGIRVFPPWRKRWYYVSTTAADFFTCNPRTEDEK